MEHRRKRCYNIAVRRKVQRFQRYAKSRRYSGGIFLIKMMATILYAEYFNNEAFMETVYYNYGTYWDFGEDEPGNVYSGYYYHKPGDTKGGITMKYSNGNTKETGYHSVDSAEDALGDILS